MFGYLVLLFTVLPALELYVLIKVGSSIGALNTIALLVLNGMLGAALARWQGSAVMWKIQAQLNKGVLPSKELLDGAMIFVGGVLLLTPGFITDIFGLFFLIPWTRGLLKILIKKKIESILKKGTVVASYTSGRPIKQYDDIDIN